MKSDDSKADALRHGLGLMDAVRREATETDRLAAAIAGRMMLPVGQPPLTDADLVGIRTLAGRLTTPTSLKAAEHTDETMTTFAEQIALADVLLQSGEIPTGLYMDVVNKTPGAMEAIFRHVHHELVNPAPTMSAEDVERAHRDLAIFNAMVSLSDEDVAWLKARTDKMMALPEAERRAFAHATPEAYRAAHGREVPSSLMHLLTR